MLFEQRKDFVVGDRSRVGEVVNPSFTILREENTCRKEVSEKCIGLEEVSIKEINHPGQK